MFSLQINFWPLSVLLVLVVVEAPGEGAGKIIHHTNDEMSSRAAVNQLKTCVHWWLCCRFQILAGELCASCTRVRLAGKALLSLRLDVLACFCLLQKNTLHAHAIFFFDPSSAIV